MPCSVRAASSSPPTPERWPATWRDSAGCGPGRCGCWPPGTGPVVEDPAAKLDEYVAHRRERERRLLEALGAGARSVSELLDGAWSEVPEILRPAATVTLAAHLDKLDDEGRLPAGVERPAPFRLSAP